MRVIGLDDREYKNWPLKKDCRNKDDQVKSGLHTKALHLLKNAFPTQLILEEIRIPGSKMRLDIYLPTERLAIEVQGRQHYEMTNFFFSDRLSFLRARERDNQKARWCFQHKIQILVLCYKEEKQWENIIGDLCNGYGHSSS